MSGSTVNNALTALVAAWVAVAPSDVLVVDGQAYDPIKPRFLCVGWDESEQPVVTGTRDVADLQLGSDAESYDVLNLLTCWAGDLTPPALRAVTFGLFDVFDAALASDRGLVTAVAQARTTDFEYLTGQRVEGSLAQIRFTVRIDAWR